MPWSAKDRPSAALGALAPYLRRAEPRRVVRSYPEYLSTAEALDFDLYDTIADRAPYTLGELSYVPLLYPERRDVCRERAEQWIREHLDGDYAEHAPAIVERIETVLATRLLELADELAEYDVVGLTTSFGQLFANLALARAIEERSRDTIVVLGGSTVSGPVGPSLVKEYGFVHYVVQGEGEMPLAALLARIDAGASTGDLRGVVSRKSALVRPKGAPFWEVDDLDELPLPDYEEYASLAEGCGVSWLLPIEGSRGCWWDRTKRAQNPRSTCYFCNLNVQWGGYREKSVARVVEEMSTLSDRYHTLRVAFVDNVLRSSGVLDLARDIARCGKDFDFFYEMRAHVRPRELLALRQAGLTEVQFGIEALSTSMLRRIGKGTTLIQNLQAMRSCHELGIKNGANLIFGFPGTTADEIEETREHLLSDAFSYQPLSFSRFQLGIESTVDTLRSEFGVSAVRNLDLFRGAVPDDVYERVELFDLDFELNEPSQDWTPVFEAGKRWTEFHASRTSPALYYRDGGSFVVVVDERSGDYFEGVFEGLARDVYLYCMEIRDRRSIAERFDLDARRVDELVAPFLEHRLMFAEGAKCLSLAVATDPLVAARRIAHSS
jgi:ribosomal peptide maturation radical SAM protein 1